MKMCGLDEEIKDRECPACQCVSWKKLFEHRDMHHGLGGEFTVILCEGCGLVSYDPLPDAETLRSYYPTDYYAHRKEPEKLSGMRLLLDDLHLGIRGNLALAALLSPFLWYKEVYSYARFLRPVPRGNLLDVGCGEGAFLAKASRMGFDCRGLEPGGAGPDRFRAGGVEIPISRCSLRDLEGFDSAFDVITLNHVFEHLSDPLESLRKLRTLLKPEGKILIRTPRTDHFLFRRHAADWFQLDMPRHVYLYDSDNFSKIAERCDLHVDSLVGESIPLHNQYAFKRMALGRPFLQTHWSDSRVFSMLLLPFCEMLKICGQADSMAVWLRRK